MPTGSQRSARRSFASRWRAKPQALFRSFRAEDRNRDRLALREIVALDAGQRIVAQTDRLGARDEIALGARFHQRKAAGALAEEIRSARSVSQLRRCIRHEDEARLMEAGRGDL